MNKSINKTRNYKRYFVISIIASPFVVFVIATVFLAIESASYGAKLHSLEEREAELTQENRELSSQMVSNTSLGELSGKSEEMGFVKPDKILYVSGDKVVAQAH